MEDKEILEMDPEFNFDGVFKQNYCTLLNIFTCEVSFEHTYTIDGAPKKLRFPEGALFSIQYKEWQVGKQFELENGNYFSTRELAFEYFKENQTKFGLMKIDRAEAIELAKECFRLQEETRNYFKDKDEELFKNKG